MPATTSLLPFDLNEVFDPEASSEEEKEEDTKQKEEEPQLKKRKLNNFFINLDKNLLINIFCYSSIIDIFKSFKFINKEFNFIFKTEEFKKIYYGNVFKLNSEEVNNLNNLLNELQNIIVKEKEEEKKLKKKKKNKNKNKNIVKEVVTVVKEVDVTKIDFTKVPFNFEHLFNYYCKLQFNSYSIYGNYLNEQILNNFKNKNFKNYKENLQKINHLTDLENAKIHLFEHFNRNNNTKNGNLCYGEEEEDQKEENEIEYISSESDSENEFKKVKSNKNPLQNKMNRIFNLFKLSKFSYNHIYPIIYRFEEDEDEDKSVIKFILFLDNGIPLFISTEFSADRSVYKIKMEMYKKLLFYYGSGKSDIDLTFITDLIDKIFILNKEELFELINKKKSNELDEKDKLKEKSFIVGYLFYLFRVFHEEGIYSSTFADALNAFRDGCEIKVILYEENGEIVPKYRSYYHCD
ncbi:hypothetical protein ABK040_013172 [Willaertia magna]